MEAGRPFAIRPAGMLALDMARMEAGLILIEVDYTSATQALSRARTTRRSRSGWGAWSTWTRTVDFVGKRALIAERDAGGPPRRLVGLEIEWQSIEANSRRRDCRSTCPPRVARARARFTRTADRSAEPPAEWSPTLKKHMALASVERAVRTGRHAPVIESSVEGRRGRAAATVVPLPFFDPPRKRA